MTTLKEELENVIKDTTDFLEFLRTGRIESEYDEIRNISEQLATDLTTATTNAVEAAKAELAKL